MRSPTRRILLLVLGAAAVMSCDTRLPTTLRAGQAGDPPQVLIDSPSVNTLVNLGDSIFVRVQAQGGNGLKRIILSGLAKTGDKDLGTYAETPRYASVTVDLPSGTTDTIIRRYLKVLDLNNKTLDSLIIQAIAQDSLGLADTSRVNALLVSGPNVTIRSPASGDSVPAGVGVSISAQATDADGIGRISIRVVGEATWPTKLDTTIVQSYSGGQRDVTLTGTALIPLDAPPRSRITVTAASVDENRQPGSSAPISLFIRSAASIAAPRVTQNVATLSERTDTVQVTATGQGITFIGIVVRDSVGNLVDRDSIPLPPPASSNVKQGIALRLPISQQGRRLAITAFAVDQLGRVGYAVRPSQAGSETVLTAATVDSTQIVYGQTYTMPLAGTVGDIAVDAGRGNVFLSNTQHNRLEVWQRGTLAFHPNGIAVGSLPWGMTVASTNPDTLLVANSGGTNISRVFIGSTSVPALREDLVNRILTRNVYVFEATESRDPNTNKITLSITDPVSYSDRPQYIAQSATGRIFYSTMPTSEAADGTIRWLDPNFVVPDPRIIWQYGNFENTTTSKYAIFNVDSVKIRVAPVNSPASDTLYVWDHQYGASSGFVFAKDAQITNLIAALVAQGSDAEAVLRLDVASLGLTDTTFVASSVNRKWLAFGEGNTGAAGRVMMVADSVGVAPNFFSPQVTVKDLTDNAAERVFGLALDRTGKTVASHGLQSYFSEVDAPFHLRLQGKYDSFDNGAGLAIHPNANGRFSAASDRLAFVGAASGTIEIVDLAYFINRGRLQLKYPIYGPLRVSGPMPGDVITGPNAVLLKLFAITQRGLIVIDLTAADIKPGPP